MKRTSPIPLLLILWGAGCTETTFEPATPDQLVITPGAATVRVGQSLRLSATASSKQRLVPLSGMRWSSNSPSVATVNSQGDVFAVSRGTVSVVATGLSGISSSAAITTIGVSLVTLTIPSAPIFVGSTATLVVRVTADPGVTPQPVVFSSSNASVASVSASGQLTAISPGQTVITVTCEGQVATSTVTVQQAPVAQVLLTTPTSSTWRSGTIQMGVSTRDASGNVLNGRTVTWTSSHPAVAAVSSTGLIFLTPSAIFTVATITATSEGVSKSVTVALGLVSGAQAAELVYQVPVTAGSAALNVILNGTGPQDPDLYLFAPSFSQVCGSENVGPNESCAQVNNPAVGTWYPLVFGYTAFANVQLIAVVSR